MEDGLGGADGHDEVGVDERWMGTGRVPVGDERAQVVRLAVVDDDLTAEVACLVRAQQGLELAPSCPSPEAPRDEDGDALARDAGTRELGEHGRERVASPVVARAREGQLGRLYHDGGAAAPWGDGSERGPGKRIPERLRDRGTDVGDRIERRRRDEQQRVVGQGDEREARAGVEWHAHAGQS